MPMHMHMYRHKVAVRLKEMNDARAVANRHLVTGASAAGEGCPALVLVRGEATSGPRLPQPRHTPVVRAHS